MPARRFPPPWSVEEQEACFVVRDHNGQALAYVYFENEPGRRGQAESLATRIEGQLTPVTVKLSYRQAGDLWVQLEPFRHSKLRRGECADPAHHCHLKRFLQTDSV
jgi:hypothetical protein